MKRFKLIKCKECGRYYSDIDLGTDYISLCCKKCIELEIEEF